MGSKVPPKMAIFSVFIKAHDEIEQEHQNSECK
jgi:hypothetical protein